eukprot:1195822-Prorocentrum_minimum.AAC.11
MAGVCSQVNGGVKRSWEDTRVITIGVRATHGPHSKKNRLPLLGAGGRVGAVCEHHVEQLGPGAPRPCRR